LETAQKFICSGTGILPVSFWLAQAVAFTGARTVSVRSMSDDESNWRIFKAPPPPRAANRDGSRSGHFKPSRYQE
jgi:hypothetical protein